MRSILCPADTTADCAARLETALALARQMRGHLTVQVASPLVDLAMWEPFGGAALTAGALQQLRANDEALAKELEARLAPQDVPFDVTLAEAARVEAIAAASRYADVIVLGLADPLLEDVTLGVRCPVLAVPGARAMRDFTAPILAAWDGGHEAANALRAALPLAALAKDFHLLTVREKPGTFPASEALRYLSSHDIHAQLHEVAPHGSIAQTIEATATRLGAGLVVMGVYGHSRLRELLLGGVTKEMLERSAVPLLLAH